VRAVAILGVGLTLLLAQPATGAPGDPDGNFGTGGVLFLSDPTGPFAGATDAALMPDGSIVAAGFASANKLPVGGLLRLDAGGLIDTTFGQTGFPSFPLPNAQSELSAILPLSDGTFLLGGCSLAPPSTFLSPTCLSFGERGTTDGQLIHVNSNGLPIPLGANATGIVDLHLDHDTTVQALAAGPGNTVFALLWRSDGFDSRLVVARFTAGGAPDPGFGKNGIVTTPFVGAFPAGASMVRQGSALVVAGPLLATPRLATGVLALDLQGRRVSSFGRKGLARLDQPGTSSLPIRVIALPAGGYAVAGFQSLADSTSRSFVLRLDPSGHPVGSFGQNGFLTFVDADVGDIAAGPSGSIYVAATHGNLVELGLFGTDGQPDPAFNGTTTPVGPPSGFVSIRRLVVNPAGITAIGDLDEANWLFVRYLAK